jgi:hypothetical protein
MAKGKPRDERKEQYWRRRIREWRASGLTGRAFCERRGLSACSFYGWRRELERRDADHSAFVPVHVVLDEPKAPGGALDLVLAEGRTVRVAPGFDAATLRQLLAVLEDKPC